eukprot:SAG22_NODE_6468_length_850_cov_1.359521_2_plen_20_part_01
MYTIPEDVAQTDRMEKAMSY